MSENDGLWTLFPCFDHLHVYLPTDNGGLQLGRGTMAWRHNETSSFQQEHLGSLCDELTQHHTYSVDTLVRTELLVA